MLAASGTVPKGISRPVYNREKRELDNDARSSCWNRADRCNDVDECNRDFYEGAWPRRAERLRWGSQQFRRQFRDQHCTAESGVDGFQCDRTLFFPTMVHADVVIGLAGTLACEL